MIKKILPYLFTGNTLNDKILKINIYNFLVKI